jgi:hypothetical protein
MTKSVVVFSRQSVDTILRSGGSGSWRLVPNHALHCGFAVCTRNAKHPKVEGPEAHHSAFLVGKIRDVVPSPRRSNRYWIQFSEYARVDIPNVWKKGDRNPVRYTTLEKLGIDPSTLKWEPMPVVNQLSEPNPQEAQPVGALTMAQAKKGLALTFGVPPEAIEITVRG